MHDAPRAGGKGERAAEGKGTPGGPDRRRRDHRIDVLWKRYRDSLSSSLEFGAVCVCRRLSARITRPIFELILFKRKDFWSQLLTWRLYVTFHIYTPLVSLILTLQGL